MIMKHYIAAVKAVSFSCGCVSFHVQRATDKSYTENEASKCFRSKQIGRHYSGVRDGLRNMVDKDFPPTVLACLYRCPTLDTVHRKPRHSRSRPFQITSIHRDNKSYYSSYFTSWHSYSWPSSVDISLTFCYCFFCISEPAFRSAN